MKTTNFYFNGDGTLSHTDDTETAIFKCRKWVKEDKNRRVFQIRGNSETLHLYRNEEIYNQAMVIWRAPKPEELPDHLKMMKLIGVI